jgi:lipopolysaccharide transport system ATP-binding protein
VAKQGRTVLFVSHNMAAVQQLCTTSILLKAGEIEVMGATGSVIAHYYSDTAISQLDANLRSVIRSGTGEAKVTSIALRTGDGEVRYPTTGDDLLVQLEIETERNLKGIALCIVIFNSANERIIDANTNLAGTKVDLFAGEVSKWAFHLRNVRLRPDQYRILTFIGIHNFQSIDHIERALTFEVTSSSSDFDETIDYPSSYRCAFEIRRLSLESEGLLQNA